MQILLVYDMSPEAIHFYCLNASTEEVDKLRKIQGSYSNTTTCTEEQEAIHSWLHDKMKDWEIHHLDSSGGPHLLNEPTLVFHCGMAL